VHHSVAQYLQLDAERQTRPMLSIAQWSDPEHFYKHAQYVKTSHRNQLVFVHIPKCGGSSVEKAMERIHDRAKFSGHTPLCVYLKLLPKTNRERLFFTVVRNPWNRAVSAFFYLAKMRQDRHHAQFWQQLGDPQDFTDFVRGLFKLWQQGDLHTVLHVCPQSSFLTEDALEHSPVMVEHICKLESLESDLQSKVPGLSSLEKEAFSMVDSHKLNSTEHAPAKFYYTPETAEIIQTIYAYDIANFGYQKPWHLSEV
jgi:hypothetical protein